MQSTRTMASEENKEHVKKLAQLQLKYSENFNLKNDKETK